MVVSFASRATPQTRSRMANRLTRIYTRTGDDGTTGLGDGARIRKDDARVIAMGEIDELNSVLGLLLTEAAVAGDMRTVLTWVQHRLFDLGGALCVPGAPLALEAETLELEQAMDTYNVELPPLKEFILPGGSRAAAVCHLARAICRRAERAVVALDHSGVVPPSALKFVNRLSDYLFVIARTLNRSAGVADVLWLNSKR